MLADQDWFGHMIFKNFTNQDWIEFNFIRSGLDLDWKISQSAHLWSENNHGKWLPHWLGSYVSAYEPPCV